MAKDVGFKGGDELFYAIPGYSLENGIDKLHDDHSLRKMLNFAKKGKSMEIYIKHLEQGVSATPIFGQDVEDNHVEETWLALQPIEIFGLWRLTVVLFKATSIIEAPGLAAAARGLSGLGSSED
ncbi:hypothetical protein OsI_26073 [Oryza sativa Indica Group]|uniref:PB1-like domain-containing protein n=1 Tax=Oryza sativa subsp. indica TaxID=39946 RepID=B8B6G6_ORYSI|nr:hypothetical protein OsI_26073 [Oryza sativa Indica Group]